MRARPPGRKQITILEAPLVDDGHGNLDPDWDNPVRTPVQGCAVHPGSSVEYLLGRDAVLAAWFVFAPAGTVVNTYNQIEYQGVQYTIYGTPEVWDEGTGADYVGIVLQKWGG